MNPPQFFSITWAIVYLCHPMKKIDLRQSDKSVAIWIMVGVGMLIIQILLGGITRLTGSGLSITQWDVITGAIPPLNRSPMAG